VAGIALAGLATCTRCARLVACRRQVSPVKGRSRADYHNAPVNGFGDLRARIGLVGLAPGAHGANRTGRPFTGDGAGDFMYPLLHQAGLASQPEAFAASDGLILHDLYITNAVKCLPPQNRPNAAEFDNCRSYLAREIAALQNLRVLIGLGHGAFRSLLRYFQDTGLIQRLGDFPFGHGRGYRLSNGLWLLGCYHTSRYNVQTGRMTAPMFLALLAQSRLLAEGENS
jgi:uracil-DNA glycosylase family 4